MLLRIYIVISITMFGLFAQSTVSNADRESIGSVQKKDTGKPKTQSAAEKALSKKVASMEKSVADKVTNLENLQIQAIEFNPELKKELLIIDEMTTNPIGRVKTITTKHVEYTFEGGNKIKEVKVVYRQKILDNEIHSVVRTLTFVPGNVESIKITVDKFDSKVKGISDVTNYSDFPDENKLQALKSVDTTLLSTIFRLDMFIQKNQLNKIEKNRSRLEGL